MATADVGELVFVAEAEPLFPVTDSVIVAPWSAATKV
jgi:hypothetical protein